MANPTDPSSTAEPPQSSGFRLRSHGADELVEAWGTTRGACIVQTVRGMVAAFADVEEVAATTSITLHPTGEDVEVLLEVLEEVITLLDTVGVLPVDLEVEEAGTAIAVRLQLAPLDHVSARGAAPKAVAWSELRLEPDEHRVWHATALVDV